MTKDVKTTAPDDSGVRDLMRRAEKGDKTALPLLRKVLDLEPDLWAEVTRRLVSAQSGFVKVLAGKNLLVAELLPRTLKSMATETAGPSPSPLEKLLSEQIAVDWLALLYAQTQSIGDMSLPEADFHQRRISSSHQRYMSAIRTLALVRKLLRPSMVQLNVAEQQVNIASGG